VRGYVPILLDRVGSGRDRDGFVGRLYADEIAEHLAHSVFAPVSPFPFPGVGAFVAFFLEGDFAAFLGALAQVRVGRHQAEDSALDAGEDDGEVVAAECDADGGELWGFAFGMDGFDEAAAVGAEDSDELEEGGDAFRHGLGGPVLCRIGFGGPRNSISPWGHSRPLFHLGLVRQ